MADNKLTKEQEQFCVAVAGGSLLVDAYISAFPYAAKWKRESAQNKGHALAKEDNIAERINELKSVLQKKSEKSFTWNHQKSVKVLASIALNKSYKEAARVNAVKALNELLGLNKPNKIDLSSSDGSVTPKPVIDVTKLSDEALEELLNARIEK